MCGLTGFWTHYSAADAAHLTALMCNAIEHRGPDDEGIWSDPAAGSATLGFRRLAIIDVSPAGHQPMASATGRYVAVFNAAIEKCSGMFAIALWDTQNGALHLVRDRLGEKPLYYGVFNGTLLFGSELKALRAHPAWRGTVDRAALSLYLRHNYVPAPYCIYENVRKVEPGTIVTFRDPADDPEIIPFWSALEVAERGIRNPLTCSDA